METTETQGNREVTLNPVSTRQKWFRRAIIVGIVLAGAGFVQVFSAPSLTQHERRLLGVWTYEGDPGSMVLHYRSDRTMRYSGRPYNTTSFARWSVDEEVLAVEESIGRSKLRYVAAQALGRVRPALSPIRFLEGGTIEMETTLQDGSKESQIMIPWTGAFADKIQQME